MNPENNSNTSSAKGGPISPEGKFQSSRNAITHGLTATTIDRFPESIREAYRALLDEQYAEWRPATSNECLYLERYVFNHFQLTRSVSILNTAMEAFHADPNDEAAEKRYTRLLRHTRALERSAKEAINELRTLITDRLAAANIEMTFVEKTQCRLGLAVTYPSHRLLDKKDTKISADRNAVRFVNEHQLRLQTFQGTEMGFEDREEEAA